MNDKEWKEYRRQAKHDTDPPQVKTGDVLGLLDERDALAAALSVALDDFRSLSKESNAKAARMRAADAYQKVRAALKKEVG